MLLLRTAPQDLPYSPGLMNRILFVYLLSGLVVQSNLVDPTLSIGRMILGILVLMFFTYIVLASLDLKARFVQTVSAMVGVGVIFNLLAWPLLNQLDVSADAESIPAGTSLMVLLLMSWELLITAHIYRNALNTSMLHAIIISLGLFFITITLSQLIFPET